MTPPSELSALMALDALGEATPEQQAELRRLLTAEPDLAAERDALRQMAQQIDTASASEAPPLAPPAHVLQRLEQARQTAVARATAERSAGVDAGNVVPFGSASAAPTASTRSAAPPHRARRNTLTLLAWAAAIAILAVPAIRWLMPPRAGEIATASPALAPRSETGMTQPTLIWDNAPDQKYDVWILPEGADQNAAPALFVANQVRSPVHFASLKPGPANADQGAALKPGTRYLALVCLAGQGRMAGVTVPFHTAPAAIGAPPAPSDPSTTLALARQLLGSRRPSDALMVLANLPYKARLQPEAVTLEEEIRKSLQATKAP